MNQDKKLKKEKKLKQPKADKIELNQFDDEQEKRKKDTDIILHHSTSKSKKYTERLFSDESNKNENNIFKKWGLTPQQVAEAEKFIIEIEERVDECCPIRGNKKLQANHE